MKLSTSNRPTKDKIARGRFMSKRKLLRLKKEAAIRRHRRLMAILDVYEQFQKNNPEFAAKIKANRAAKKAARKQNKK